MLEELKKRPSAMALVAANLLPLVGVAFWGWDAFDVVALYWMENLILGAINILKMVTCRPDGKPVDVLDYLPGFIPDSKREEFREKMAGQEMRQMQRSGMKYFMIPFFTVHYFGFCAGHGVFVFSFFGQGSGGLSGGLFSSFSQIPELLTGGFALAALGLMVSHLFSFFSNYIGKGEYRRINLPILMFMPYGRIVVLHIAIIAGGFLVMALGSPVGLLLILVVGKIFLDLRMHLREHRRVGAAAVDPDSAPVKID